MYKPNAVVVGSSGRVGRLIVKELRKHYDLLTLDRETLTPINNLEVQISRADVLFNFAGMAHLHGAVTPKELQVLYQANVELPRNLAYVCRSQNVKFVHLSSTKAAGGGRKSCLYGSSKALGEAAITSAALSPGDGELRAVSVRTPAVLAPPFEAGNLGKLASAVRSYPLSYIPNPRMPAASTSVLAATVLAAADSQIPVGHKVVDVGTENYEGLRSVVRHLRMSQDSASVLDSVRYSTSGR